MRTGVFGLLGFLAATAFLLLVFISRYEHRLAYERREARRGAEGG